MYRALLPCWGGCRRWLRKSCSGELVPTLQLLHWKPWSWGQWGSLTGAAKYSGAGCPYHSMKGALLVILCMGSFELCSVQPTEGCVKPWHPSHLTERNSMTKSPTAAWRLVLYLLCPQPPTSSLLLWGPNPYSENKSRLRRNLISYYYCDLTQYEEAQGEPCPWVQGMSAVWLNLRLSTQLPARAVLPQALAQLYWCLELF